MMTLEQIFLSPYFWRPPKVCEFLKRTLKLLRDNKREDEVKQFTDKMDKESILPQNCVWSSAGNWKDVLVKIKLNNDKTLFDICITRYEGNKQKRGKGIDENLRKISFLWKIIRDKYEHSGDLPAEDKKKLGWFTETGNLSDALFVQFWTNLFPRLVPYVWKQFRQFRDCPTLQEYYSFPFDDMDIDQLPIDLEEMLKQLNSALIHDLEIGGLATRYSSILSLKGSVLEFRNLSIGGVLQGCSLMKTEVLQDAVTWKWYEISGGVSQVMHEIKLRFGNGQVGENFPACLVVGNIVLELVAQVSTQLKHGMNVGSGHSRVIAFTGLDNGGVANQLGVINHLMGKIPGFVEMPVQWSELSEVVRERVENHGLLSFQNTKVKIIEALEIDDVVRSNIFSDLNGPILTRFLRGSEIKVFEKISIPAILNNYKSRVLFDRSLLSSMIFQERLKRGEIFLVANISRAELQPLVKYGNDCIVVCNDDNISTVIKLSSQIFLLQTEISTRREFEKYFPAFKNVSRNIHCVRYLSESKRFLWVTTQGSLSGVEDLFLRAAKDGHDVMMKEVEVIKAIEERSENMVVIADKPGMGKTQVLVKLANTLVSTASNKLVVFVSFHHFMKTIRATFNSPRETLHPDKVDVVLNNLVNLVCQNSFEKNLLRCWLTTKQSKIKIELLMDGLDELLYGERDYAFKIIKVLRYDLCSIRVWVTVRDHMLDEIRKKFGSLGYKLEPFTEEEQIDFLEQHWTEYLERRKIVNKNVNSESLRNFARKCIKVPLSADETDIAGIPLQCRMIAEINEQKVVDGDLSIDPTVSYTLIRLYEQLMERKFVVYLTEKNKLSEINMTDHVARVLRNYAESIHIHFALKLIFNEDLADNFLHKLFIKTNCKEQLSASVLEHGVVQSLNPLTFVHRTFAEFIIAQFVCRVLRGDFLNIDRADSTFENFLWNEVLSVVDCNVGGCIRKFNFKLPTVCHFLNTMLEEETPVVSNLRHLFADIWKKLSYNCQSEILYLNDISLFIAAVEMSHNNILALLFSSKSQSLTFVITMLRLCQYGICKYIIENFPDFGPKNWHVFQEYEGMHCGILHWCVFGLLGYFYRMSVTQPPYGFQDFLRFAVAKDPSVLEQKDAKGRTPLLLLVQTEPSVDKKIALFRSMSIKFVKIFVTDLQANIFATDNEGTNVLHYLHEFINPAAPLRDSFFQRCLEIFSQRQSLKQLVNAANKDGLSPFQIALDKLGNAEPGYLECYVTAGADLNCSDKHGNTPLHTSIEKGFRNDFMQQLIRFGANILAKNRKGQCALHVAVKHKNLDLVKVLARECPKSLLATDNEGYKACQYDTSDDVKWYLKTKHWLLIFHWDH